MTLLELILVMALLMILAAEVVPRFSGFSEGRRFDAEWELLLSQLRYARSEAISRSVPVAFWFDRDRHVYGLRSDSGYEEGEWVPDEHELPESIELAFRDESLETAESTRQDDDTQTVIVFQPDGSVDADSPAYVDLSDDRAFRTAHNDAALGYVRVQGEEETTR